MQVGLTSAEVAEQIQQGFVNQSRHSNRADYYAILSRNLFNVFNCMVAPAAVALFLLREPQAGIAVSGMAIVNTVLGLVQEVRAKRHLDQLAILGETKARVLRDGRNVEIRSGEVVLGDTIFLNAGDAVVADGPVLEAQQLEVDEALLTGEADPVRRAVGSPLLSGSICVAGQGCYRAEKVGGNAYAQTLSSLARRYHYSSSPMTHDINRIIELLTLIAIALSALYVGLFYFQRINTDQMVLMIAATITSMVPQGLVLTATIAFTLGAVAMSRRGALVQRLNAVEAMAAIDMICTDKTGTLTTNRLRVVEFQVLDPALSDGEFGRRVGIFASVSVDQQNKSVQALLNFFGEQSATVIDQIPFKSQERFSGVRIRDRDRECILWLGAPEVLLDLNGRWVTAGTIDSSAIGGRQARGLRTLLFAEVADEETSKISFATLPPQVTVRVLGIIALGDELRAEAAGVIQALTRQGIGVKVVSGDNPNTVQATIAGVGLAGEQPFSGQQTSTDVDWTVEVQRHNIFGRIAPHQKVEIVEALQRCGHRVAMIGDGVNDVLALKRAELGIAMGEGTQAAKSVSALVLENNRFSLLPEAIEEGRTIVRNLRRAAKLFLVKNVYSLLMILVYASGVADIAFPYRPQQVTLLNWLVIGLPALIIAFMKERTNSPTRTSFLAEVGSFAIRTGVIFGLAGVVTLSLTKHAWGYDEKTQRTMLLSVLILLGLSALFRALKDGEAEPLLGDSRLRWCAAGAVPIYALMMYWHFSARFFELTPLHPIQWLQIMIVALPAIAATWFERSPIKKAVPIASEKPRQL